MCYRIHVLVGSRLHFDRLMVHVTIMLRKVATSDAFSTFLFKVCMCIYEVTNGTTMQTLDKRVNGTNPQIIDNISAH